MRSRDIAAVFSPKDKMLPDTDVNPTAETAFARRGHMVGRNASYKTPDGRMADRNVSCKNWSGLQL